MPNADLDPGSSGQAPADRAIGRPGPAPRMNVPGGAPVPPKPPAASISRPSVMIPPSAPDSMAGQNAARLASAPPIDAMAAPPVSGQIHVTSESVRPASQARPSAPRQARLSVVHLDPWSVMKSAFMLSIALAVTFLTATIVIWFLLSAAGVFEAITRTASEVGGAKGGSVSSIFGFTSFMGVALIVSALEVLLVSAFATVFAYLYNISVGITGGFEVTLAEER
jgi:hypothetical protein